MHFVQINKTTWRCTGEGPRNPATGKRQLVVVKVKAKQEIESKKLLPS